MANRIPEDAWPGFIQKKERVQAKPATVGRLSISDTPADYLVMDLILEGGLVQVAICPDCLRNLAEFIDAVKVHRPHIFED